MAGKVSKGCMGCKANMADMRHLKMVFVKAGMQQQTHM